MITLLGSILNPIIITICLALGVGFYTLVERNTLSYIQLRNGPNNAGFIGLPQPLADAANLFTNESPVISNSLYFVYTLSPVVSAAIILTLWSLYMSNYNTTLINLGLLFFIVVSSLNVYSILLSGWSSNSNYALIGAIRAIAQTISYEISIALIIITILLLSLNFNLLSIASAQLTFFPLAAILPVIFAIWIITSLAETNRAPFDLAEGESELVSGFNIEYGSGEFALLFIAEYGSILFISILTSCILLGTNIGNLGIIASIKLIMISFVFLWVRGSFPRMRYDTLISLTWNTFLTLSISFICVAITSLT